MEKKALLCRRLSASLRRRISGCLPSVEVIKIKSSVGYVINGRLHDDIVEVTVTFSNEHKYVTILGPGEVEFLIDCPRAIDFWAGDATLTMIWSSSEAGKEHHRRFENIFGFKMNAGHLTRSTRRPLS